MTPTLRRSIPFFDYPQLYTAEEEMLVAIFRDVGRRGAFILQQDLARFEENLARFARLKFFLRPLRNPCVHCAKILLFHELVAS